MDRFEKMYDDGTSEDEDDCDEFEKANNVILIGTKIDLVEDRICNR
jgi:hypothetical protein